MADFTTIGAIRPAELPWLVRTGATSWTAAESPRQRAKRVLDVTLCLAFLPVAILILLICGMAIRLESSGPVFEHDRHAGRGGRAFLRYRFRTTRPGPRGPEGCRTRTGAAGDGSLTLVPKAVPTRVGRVLLRSRIVGLPQIFNVLRGDMSLVGPPAVCYGVGLDQLWHTARFDARPGIVSPARVARPAGALDDVERLRRDIAYIRNATIARDVQILLHALDIVTRGARYLVKRGLDVVMASVLIVIFSPLMIGLAATIRWSSPGAILFRQARAGLNGRYFDILKFRTMRMDAEEALRSDPELYREYVENDYKLPLETDPRVTPIGRWLRKTSLDELPQLFNVLFGDMSLVGPRPVVSAELEHYRHRAPTLLSVLPGVTGEWQVSGRNNIRYPERCEVELEYVHRWSLTHDFVILYRTVGSTISGRGAL